MDYYLNFPGGMAKPINDKYRKLNNYLEHYEVLLYLFFILLVAVWYNFNECFLLINFIDSIIILEFTPTRE
jgi:hypothetical protein